MAQNLNGELARRADFGHFSGAGKAQSASERPTVQNAERSEHGVLNTYDFFMLASGTSFDYYRKSDISL